MHSTWFIYVGSVNGRLSFKANVIVKLQHKYVRPYYLAIVHLHMLPPIPIFISSLSEARLNSIEVTLITKSTVFMWLNTDL
jgi:hypothetical protein